MANYLKARTPILAIVLSLLAVGYTFAANKVVVIPMAADVPAATQWALVRSNGTIITGSSGVSSTRAATGQYFISFGKDVSGYAIIASSRDTFKTLQVNVCAASATIDNIGCNAPYNNSSHVLVSTNHSSGALANSSFYVAALP